MVSLVREIIKIGGYSLFLLKPIGNFGEKVKSVVFTFSVKYQILSSHASFRADENLRRDIAITSYRTPSSILHKCPQAVAYKIHFGRRKTPPHAFGY